MSTPRDANPTPQDLGEALAAQLGQQDWVLDEADLLNAELPTAEAVDEPIHHAVPASPPSEADVPMAEAVVEAEVPPTPLQIIEAMLFIGGAPLTAEKACALLRGLSKDQFRETIEVLNRVYRSQNRPYAINSTEQGYMLAVRPRYRSIRDKIYGGVRAARLTQPALDVLSLVAYRQPAAKNEIDAVRGVESGPLLRQLVRLGLISVVQRAEASHREVCYGTTDRFLELFSLKSLDDLPKTGDPQRL